MIRWISLTYGPKIPAVRAGDCRQTIRPGTGYREGDRIGLHGWEGRPYRSSWSFRTGIFTLENVIPIVVYPDHVCRGLYTGANNERGRPIVVAGQPFTTLQLDEIARLDYIDPPTGEELLRVMSSMHDLRGGVPMQILRWL